MSFLSARVAILLLLVGCGDGDGKPAPEGVDTGSGDTDVEDTETDTEVDTDTDTEPPPTDADGDGFVTEVEGGDDCDDANADVHPWAEETCEDGLDTNCDGIDGRCGAWESGDMASVADAAFWGENAGDAAGADVLLEDMNGDGLDDALVTAPGHGRYARDAGALYVVFAPLDEGGMPLSLADARVDGLDREERFHVPAVGDADGDGLSDLLMGAPVADEVILLAGPISGEVTPADAVWQVGWDSEDVAWVGEALDVADFDGDGAGELVVGADEAPDESGYAEGKVSVLPGTTRGSMWYEEIDDAALATLRGNRVAWDEVACVGWSLAHADLDGDGLDDLIAGGSDSETGVGGFYLVLSPFTGERSVEDADGVLLGDVAGVRILAVEPGDIDGDGAVDLVVGDPSDSTTAQLAGAVYVVSGYTTGTQYLADARTKLLGAGQYESAGSAVAVGDFDDNSHVDVAIGGDQLRGSESSETRSFVQIVYEVPAGTVDLLASAGTLWTAITVDYLGSSLAVGDTDAAGGAELLIGADMSWGKTNEPGSGYLMQGL